MRVHVVFQDGAHIIPRIARYLVGAPETLAWTLGNSPDPRADLNYFVPYLDRAELHPGFDATPTAAYFSHREENHDHKAVWWEQAAQSVNLRIATAPMYADELAEYGPTALVRPPIEREHFTIGPQKASAKHVVGVAGYVYAQTGRKGEGMVARLRDDKAFEIELISAGRHWPAHRNHYYEWAQLPDFYRALDVFLCTSLIEGIPATVLEAMACGVPVVIPQGVGMLDTLPDLDGVYRYKRGDYGSMAAALHKALKGGGDPDALRAATSEYTPDNWRYDHVRAFEDLLFDAEPAQPGPDWGPENAGLYMVAFGPPARACAKKAIASFRRHMDLPVCLVSNAPLDAGEDVFIEQPDSDIGGRGAKMLVESLAPEAWEYVLYLDADTEVVAPIGYLFDLLRDGWEFVICKNPGKYHSTHMMQRPDNGGECAETWKLMGGDEFIQYNGGVWAYRRTDAMRFVMRRWRSEWDRYGKRDQQALLRVLHAETPRIYVLGNDWNTVDRYCADPEHPERESAGIVHRPMTARRHVGITYDRLDSAEAWGLVQQNGYAQGQI